MKYHLTHIRMATTEKTEIESVGEDMQGWNTCAQLVGL